MIKSILAFLFLVACAAIHAQIPAIEWKKCYGGTAADNCQAIKPTPDGGYIMIGSTMSSDGDAGPLHGTAGSDRDVWVVKIDGSGDISWQRSYGGTQQDFGNDIENTSDGGYIFCGRTYSNNGDGTGTHGGVDAWVVKISGDGAIQWQQAYGSSGADGAYDIVESGDGYVFCGFSGANGGSVSGFHGIRDAWVVRIAGDGTLLWQKSLGGGNEDYAYKVIPVGDDYIIGAETLSPNGDVNGHHGGTDMWVIKLDGSGGMLWNYCYGASGRQELNDIAATPDGGFILAGNVADNGSGGIPDFHNPGTGNFGTKDDYWLVKITSNGALQWAKCYGGTDNDVATRVAVTDDGGYIILGYSDSNNGDNDSFFTFNHWDYWAIKTDASGAIQWQETYGGSEDDAATDILALPDHSYVLAGFSTSTDQQVTDNHGNNDFFIVKLAPDALSLPGFSRQHLSFYPNPATGAISVSAASDQLRIYDLNGRRISSAAGSSIDVSRLPSGTYVIEASIDGKTLASSKFIRR